MKGNFLSVLFLHCRGHSSTYWLVDSRTRANHVDLTKFSLGHLKHALELDPVRHIGLLEDHSSLS